MANVRIAVLAADTVRSVVMLAWGALSELGAYRITEIPRRAGPGTRRVPPDEPGDTGRTQRLAALTAAYHAGAEGNDGPAALAFGWVRHDAGQPVQVLTAGAALVGGEDGEDVCLTLPGGARAEPLARGALAGLMARLPSWRAIAGISDGLLLDDPRPDGQARTPPTLEECLLAVWPGPFGWLLVAEPLTAAEIGEARAGRSAGWWRIRLLAGGADAGAASRVAGLVCASTDLAGLPYAVVPVPGGEPGGLREILDEADPASPGGDARPAYPFYGSTELLAVLTRPPEHELPGIRLTLRPDFDVTQEHTGASGPGRAAIDVGEILDRNRRPAGPLALPLDALNRHVLVSGAAGSGKSQTVRAMLEAATGAGIPWLVIEPSRAEYRLMAARLAGTGARLAGTGAVVRIRPGESDSIAAGLNPLEPAPDADGRRFPLQAHADLVKALFLASFRSQEPFSQVIGAALTRVYEEAGWDLALGETVTADPSPGYPSLTDLHRAAIRVVQETGYSQRVADEVLGFVRIRLSSLRLGTSGRFFEGGHQLDFGRLLSSNAVVEVEDVDDDGDQAFLIGTVLIRLAEHLRMAGPDGQGLRHLTILEEAHRLLRRPQAGVPAGAAARAVETFAGLLTGLRAYGEGVIVTERIPERLLGDVIRNTAVKITHRLPAAEDREAVGTTMNMTPAQNRFLVTLRPGEAAVFAEGMDFPLLARMPDGTAREAAAVPAASPAAAGDEAPDSAAGVVRPRSVTCGADCAARPCTLRDMRVAQRALEEYPAIRLWAELSVLAHLTGWPMPVPRTTLLSLLQVMPSRLRDCAISHGVDTAVGVRVPVIVGRVSPVGLASHVSTAIRARVARGSWLCQREEPKWLAPAYTWTLVLDALKAADRKTPGAGPHPRSAEWERTYGQAITGDTGARQVGTVQRWYDAAQRDDWEVRAVAFGVDIFSGVERAVGARAEDDDFEERFSGYLDQFVDCQWPRLYLAADPLGDPPERR